MKYKITNGKVLTYTNENGYSIIEDDIFIKDGIIYKIGSLDNDNEYEIVNANNQLVMPGLINMHTHAYMSVLKNYADDVPFDEWLFKRIMPVEESLSPTEAYWSSMLACIEMISTGTTCFTDMHMFKAQSCKAAIKSGMRAFIGRGLVGEDLFEDGYGRYSEALEEKSEYDGELIQFLLSPHAIYSCSEKLLKQIDTQSKKLSMLKQIHLSESDFEVENSIKKYGKTPVEFLYDLGFLDHKTILAHCTKMTDNDIELVRKCGASIVTNPSSNAKLGNGIAPVNEFLRSGINVCLGTDSVASNNTLNMFREMGLISLLHKANNNDPMLLSSNDVLKMSTINAAKAVGMQNLIGVISEGAFADLVFIDLNSCSLYPNNNIVTSLCYSANGSEVSSVMINGEFIMRNKVLLTIDVEQVYFEIQKIIENHL